MNAEPYKTKASQLTPLVEVTRGGRVESIHTGAVAVVDANGRLVAHAGDPDWVTYLRSAAKPLQLLPLVESGGADRFGFTDQELAVMAASHSGEPRHIETVQSILDKIGLGEDMLHCGAHWPMSDATTRRLRDSGHEPTPIYHNCSGKHAGMLAQAVHRGLSTHDYLDPRHPIQAAILTTLAEMSGVEVGAIDVAIDGCSAPCFALPLRAAARAFARLADPSALPGLRRRAVKRMVDAMIAFPEMVGGERRLDTDLMRAARGGVLSKGGAEGYHGMAILTGGLGITIKIADGNGQRGCGPVAIEALRQLGVLDDTMLAELRAHHTWVVKNHRQLDVGEVRPVFKLVP
ncbi:MAG: asparaginase [Anaerolineae bacterium]